MEYEPVIGLEIHLQLATASKMFCPCPNYLGRDDAAPNTLVCPVCLGMPGTLPSLNAQAVTLATKLAVALAAQINQPSRFDRKNYSYPDLPKGYQITQFYVPFAAHGRLVFNYGGQAKALRLHEMHLEEDTGKITHAASTSLVDYNRAGSPLIELVFEPDLREPAAAKAAVSELRLLARVLGVSDADMERGHLRCDANVSVRPSGSKELGEKVEVKNMNSLRSIQRALEYEVQRQTRLWEAGTPPEASETRGWDERQQITLPQRSKEGRHDYRYFPEPDLPPLLVAQDEVEVIREAMPVLPQQRRELLQAEYGLAAAAAALLVERGLDDYFSQVVSEGREWVTAAAAEGTAAEEWASRGAKFAKAALNWLDELLKHVDASAGVELPTAENFAEFLTLVLERRVNSTSAQVLLQRMVETGGDPSSIVESGNLAQVGDVGKLAETVEQVLAANQQAVLDLQAGKQNALKHLVGAAMKASGGTADPEAIRRMLIDRLGLEY